MGERRQEAGVSGVESIFKEERVVLFLRVGWRR